MADSIMVGSTVVIGGCIDIAVAARMDFDLGFGHRPREVSHL